MNSNTYIVLTFTFTNPNPFSNYSCIIRAKNESTPIIQEGLVGLSRTGKIPYHLALITAPHDEYYVDDLTYPLHR